MFPGPQELGVTGDNTYDTLFGRAWAFLKCDDDNWFLLQWVGADDLLVEGLDSPGWKTVDEPLLALPGLVCGVQRRFSAAFDQSARLIVAYEEAGSVKVTRWDSGAGEYVQNVDFAGRDPCLLMDATLVDPRGYPSLADDGWSVRESFFAGVPVLFEWLPEPAWRETAIPDSDVLVFYLSADRERVLVRVQREVYSVERVIHDFGEAVVLDQAVALAGRYQLLVSDQVGVRLPEALISDAYLGDFLINPRVADGLAAAVASEAAVATAQSALIETIDPVGALAAADDVRVESQVLFVVGVDDVAATAVGESVRVEAQVLPVEITDAVGAGVSADAVLVSAQFEITEDDDAISATVGAEGIRVQRV